MKKDSGNIKTKQRQDEFEEVGVKKDFYLAEEINNKTYDNINLRDLFILMISDVDIFLLQKENQLEDKNKLFSTEEIRHQLSETLKKFVDIYNSDLEIPISKAFKIYTILKPSSTPFSETEKKELIKEVFQKDLK